MLHAPKTLPLFLLLSFLQLQFHGEPLVEGKIKFAPPAHFETSQQSDISTQIGAQLGSLQLNGSVGDPSTNIRDAAEEPNRCSFGDYRLPTGRFLPSHYNLLIAPHLDTFTFAGALQISVNIGELNPQEVNGSQENGSQPKGEEGEETDERKHNRLAANQIVLHAEESLKIDKVWYLGMGNSKSKASPYRYIEVRNLCQDKEFQLLVITLAEDLEPNSEGQLHFTFNGTLSDSLKGFYRSSYLSANGHLRYLAVTQFQPTEARRAFPCFDEPALKATFEVALILPADRVALSNMEPIFEHSIRESGLNQGNKLVRFAPTPIMSTYLLAFAVGEFDYLERNLTGPEHGEEKIAKNKTLRVRVYTPPRRTDEARVALDTAVRALERLQDYFALDVPLKKLDLVSVDDFENGAMENWGMLVFKRDNLLVDEANSEPTTWVSAASTVVHELVHQWFGNLVTLDWWNELWLNEGMTSWLEYKLMGELYPELDIPLLYLQQSLIVGMNADSTPQTHPVLQDQEDIQSQREIADLFDRITYQKAAALVRIVHDHYLKAEPFKKAMRAYVNETKYGTVTTDDLSLFLEHQMGGNKMATNESEPTPLAIFLDSWLLQPGHPLVKVTFRPELNEISLEQERFIIRVEKLNEDEAKQRWLIPISILVRGRSLNGGSELESVISITMSPTDGAVRVPLPSWFNAASPGNWVKLNHNFTGFYRVQYPWELLRLMRQPIKQRTISPADLVNVIDEAYSLSFAKKLPLQRLARILSWIPAPNNGVVLSNMVVAYTALLEVYSSRDSNLARKVEAFGRLLFGNLYSTFRLTNGHLSLKGSRPGHIDMIGRANVLSLLVRLDHKRAIGDSLALFGDQRVLSTDSPLLAPYLRSPVYVAVAKRGSVKQFESLFRMANQTNSSEERTRIVRSLARANDPARLERVWQEIKLLDARTVDIEPLDVLLDMTYEPEGKRLLKNLLDHHLSELVALTKDNSVTSLVEELCLSMGPSSLVEMNSFFLRHKEASEFNSTQDYVRQTIEWYNGIAKIEAAEFESWLDAYLSENS